MSGDQPGKKKKEIDKNIRRLNKCKFNKTSRESTTCQKVF